MASVDIVKTWDDFYARLVIQITTEDGCKICYTVEISKAELVESIKHLQKFETSVLTHYRDRLTIIIAFNSDKEPMVAITAEFNIDKNIVFLSPRLSELLVREVILSLPLPDE